MARNLPCYFVKDLSCDTVHNDERWWIFPPSCCLLLCVVFQCFLVLYWLVSLELEIRAYKERLEALERGEKQLVATPLPAIPTNGECIIKVWFLC